MLKAEVFFWLIVHLGGIIFKRIMHELGKNFHKFELYHTYYKYESSQLILNAL